MRKFLLLLIVIQPMLIFAQHQTYIISDIKLNIRFDTLSVDFFLGGKHASLPTKARLYFFDHDLHVYKPENVSPDTLFLFQPGKHHQINWKINEKAWKKDKMLSPLVVIGNPSSHHFGMGPEAALLSLLVPGLGDYFVEDTRYQRIKPYMRTAAVAAFLSAGIFASNQRYQTEPSYTDNGNIWKTGEVKYKFFRNDAELLIGTGVAIWLSDIIWVAIRGTNNRTLKKNFNTMIISL
jgi:hypothetical protein